MTESDAALPSAPTPEPAAAPAPMARPAAPPSPVGSEVPPSDADPDPAPIADGVLRQLDPNTIRVERTASWIFSAIVGLFLLIQLMVNLFGGPWRIALGLALTIGVGGFLAWLSHRWPEISYRHTFYRVDTQGIEIRRGVLWRRTITVPKSRVQHTDVSQGPLQRTYALGTLVVYTAGTDHAKVELPGLSYARAVRIRDHLLPSGGDDAV
ncbi:MAG TPA: PH domain-containing protein [Vicinamibacterales bacterium]|nr:PH domain-containing protein [Vicinamibacterales bacterium]